VEGSSLTEFNNALRERTISFAICIYSLLDTKHDKYINRPMIIQLARCSSSVASNCRAALRARSDAEFFSKICIVVEECDETLFWIEYLNRINFFSPNEAYFVIIEAGQLLKIFNSIKVKMKKRLANK
jgi:four helix bundle protein